MKGRRVWVSGMARIEAVVGERSLRGRVRKGARLAAEVAGREVDIDSWSDTAVVAAAAVIVAILAVGGGGGRGGLCQSMSPIAARQEGVGGVFESKALRKTLDLSKCVRSESASAFLEPAARQRLHS